MTFPKTDFLDKIPTKIASFSFLEMFELILESDYKFKWPGKTKTIENVETCWMIYTIKQGLL